MRAVLLAAGRGTRLRPLTERVPKCLVPVAGEPLLGHWLALLARHGVDEVLVNTHHLAGQVRAYVRGRDDGARPRVRLAHEPELLGSAGTLLAHRDFVGDDDFLVCYADTLTTADLTALVRAHRAADAPATLALFRAPDPTACGVVELDDAGRITAFHEKPADPPTDLAFAGFGVFSPAFLAEAAGDGDAAAGARPLDLAGAVLPRFAGRIQGIEVAGYVRDIGTPEQYERAQREWHEVA